MAETGNTDVSAALTESRQHELTLEGRRARLELLRMSKEVLVEMSRSKPVNENDIAASDVVAYATVLENYVQNGS